MSKSVDSGRIDTLWAELAPHVEWPEGFSLILLFAGHPGPAGALRERFERSVSARGKTLRVVDPQSAEETAALVSSVLETPEEACGGLWVSLIRRAGDPTWTPAVRELLQRLNERRFLLERDVRVPVVLVLPLELRSEVYVLAPDLWTVRSFAEQVPGVVVRRSRGPILDGPGASIRRGAVEDDATFGWAVPPPGRAEGEWARLFASRARRSLAAGDGFRAYEAARERGDLRAARRIAMETLAVALSRGGVEVERLDELDLADALTRADLRGPSDLRDLSLSLNKLGEVEVEAGNLAAAHDIFLRVLNLNETLAKADPHSAQAQRDLSLSLERLGNVEVQAGDLSAARDLFLRALHLHEALAKADPDDAQAQRDLSISLNMLGNVEVQAGDLAAARDFFLRSLHLVEALATADPHNAAAAFDLVKSLECLARLADREGDPSTELQHLHRASALLAALHARGHVQGSADREQLMRKIANKLSS